MRGLPRAPRTPAAPEGAPPCPPSSVLAFAPRMIAEAQANRAGHSGENVGKSDVAIDNSNMQKISGPLNGLSFCSMATVTGLLRYYFSRKKLTWTVTKFLG